MRKVRLLIVLACSAALFTACASLLGPRTIEVSRAQIERELSRRFPANSRYLELFDVTVSAPKLRLLPERNRVATELDISVADRLLRTPFKGSLDMNYGLRFEPGDNTIRLADVRVERFVVDEAPGTLRGQVNRLGALLAEQLLDGQVIHTLRPEDVRGSQGRGYQPGDLKVTSHGVTLTLEPVR